MARQHFENCSVPAIVMMDLAETAQEAPTTVLRVCRGVEMGRKGRSEENSLVPTRVWIFVLFSLGHKKLGAQRALGW